MPVATVIATVIWVTIVAMSTVIASVMRTIVSTPAFNKDFQCNEVELKREVILGREVSFTFVVMLFSGHVVINVNILLIGSWQAHDAVNQNSEENENLYRRDSC